MITMTPTAEQKIRKLLEEEKDSIGVRVFLKAGCPGYQLTQLADDVLPIFPRPNRIGGTAHERTSLWLLSSRQRTKNAGSLRRI